MSSDIFKFFVPTSRSETEAQKALDKVSVVQIFLSDEDFIKLRDIIYLKSGIYFTESKKYLLEGRISKRVTENKLSSFTEYVNLLNSPACTQEEINELCDTVTINETYFFRGEEQLEAFEKIVVPELMRKKTGNSPVFRIWSAATSTGEEAYTLAMIILEKIKPAYPDAQFQILASDINKSVLEAAKAGIYKEYAVRNVPNEYMNKYFRKQGTHYLLNDEVKKMVKLANLNLYDSVQMSSVRNCDIILCCNVLIYFDLPSKQQVVTHLHQALNTSGYLFIGYSESLHGVSKAFKLIHLPKAMAYKKE